MVRFVVGKQFSPFGFATGYFDRPGSGAFMAKRLAPLQIRQNKHILLGKAPKDANARFGGAAAKFPNLVPIR